MIAQFAGQNQRNRDERWAEIMMSVNSSVPESTNNSPAFLTQGREPRLPDGIYDRNTLGRVSGRKRREDEGNLRDSKEKPGESFPRSSKTLMSTKKTMEAKDW